MNKKYTYEERLQHLKDAYEFVRTGKGSHHAYAQQAGVPRGTYYTWVKKHSDEAGVPVRGRKNPQNQALVAIGKPKKQETFTGSEVIVEFFDSKISIHSEKELLMVLKTIKKASI